MFCGLEEDKITGLSIRLSPTGVECIKSFGSRRNYRVLKLGNMPKATVDIQPSDFRFGWGRNYMVLKLVLLPIHSFWWRKSYMVLKRSSSSAGWKKIELHGTQTSGLGQVAVRFGRR